MNKMTYKEFEREINKMGCHMGPEWKQFVCIANDDDRTIATVSKTHCKVLALDWPEFKELADSKKELVGDLCWQLASTPLADREEPKRYYLRIVEPYMSFFDEEYPYLNMNKQTRKAIIDSKGESVMFKTTFTIDEIEALEQEHDLSLFEKVEVDDD